MMRSFSTCALGAILSFISLLESIHASKDLLVLDLHRPTAATGANANERRQTTTGSSNGSIPLGLTDPNGYCAVLKFGIPPVDITLRLGALSSDTWVNVANSTFCSEASNNCATYGYSDICADDPSKSETSHWDSDDFSIYYGVDPPYQTANGSWFNDTVQIGEYQFYNAQFAVANQSYISEGALGLGYIGDESTNPDTEYLNFPYQLYQNGDIDCNAWSIWLDPVNQSNGQLVFGGVDSNRFIGALEIYTVQPSPGTLTTYTKPYIDLADMILVSDGKNTSLTSGSKIQVLPDAAENYSAIPEAFFKVLVKAITGVAYPGCNINGIYKSNCLENDIMLTDCGFLENDTSTSLDFVFSSTNGQRVYSIPISEIILNFQGTCAFMFQPTNGTDYILASNFLRSAYVVYDFLHNQVSMAPTNKAPTGSRIQVIPAAGVANAGFSGFTASSTASATATSTASASSSATSTPARHSGLSTGSKIGIGVGVPLGVLLLLALGALLFLRRRRHSRATGPEVSSYPPQGYGSDKQQVDNHGRGFTTSPTSPRSGYVAAASPNPEYERHEFSAANDTHLNAGQRISQPFSDVTSSDHYASTAVGSNRSGGHEHGVYELTTDGGVSPVSPGISRKPVGSPPLS